jgi:hypothetical protein
VREQRNKAIRAHAEPFVHADIAVTTDRLDSFANATIDDQLATLATLRERAADSGSTELAVLGIAIAVLIALLVPTSGLTDYGAVSSAWELLGRIVASVIVGFVVVALIVAGGREWLQRDRRRELAAVWLAAYDDELTRRAELRVSDSGRKVWFRRLRPNITQSRTVR